MPPHQVCAAVGHFRPPALQKREEIDPSTITGDGLAHLSAIVNAAILRKRLTAVTEMVILGIVEHSQGPFGQLVGADKQRIRCNQANGYVIRALRVF